MKIKPTSEEIHRKNFMFYPEKATHTGELTDTNPRFRNTASTTVAISALPAVAVKNYEFCQCSVCVFCALLPVTVIVKRTDCAYCNVFQYTSTAFHASDGQSSASTLYNITFLLSVSTVRMLFENSMATLHHKHI